MGRSRHQLTIRVPIPTQMPADAVMAALQLHSPLIRHQALVTRFQRRPVDLASIVDDSFFASDGQRITQFDVYEKITFVPGVAHKEISFPVIMQSTRDAVRCRADAPAGIRLWSEYRIERRRAPSARPSSETDEKKGRRGHARGRSHGRGAPGEKDDVPAPAFLGARELASTNGYEGFENGHEVFDLVEDVLVEGNSMLMPFVSRSMESAHRDLCTKIINEVGQKLPGRGDSLSTPLASPRRSSH